MSRRRRRRSGSDNASGSNQPSQQKQQKQSNQPSQQSNQSKAEAVEAFWGEGTDDEAAPVERIRPTPDPAALPRSLGDPPLTPDTAAAHHVAVVYEEAVRAATALAAANDLLDAGD
jgi:hypothetical protein